ncbi:hypothetical protein BD410DRAFT_779671 [Rickenella mellea]|uniref:Uncharacterized protein n=1 Tax=Rickenella mellea TaxID=50990 RepID=A0A4R5XE12_9AGAM|nr:hypothetical protein BD410DRAFT_779671 [Rickenella mellea]
MPVPLAPNNAQQLQNGGRNGKPSNIKRKSSKPFINWFQRKIAGTVRTRRVSTTEAAQKPTSLKEMHTLRHSQARDVDENGFRISHEMCRGVSNEISLNEDESRAADDARDDTSTHRSGSIWSRSNPPEADEDASIRPLPPTSPPSPSPSRSSSSYLSDPRTFKSMSTSTKPTTVMSVDLTAGATGMAHIAQAPPTPTTTGNPGPFPAATINVTSSPATTRFPHHVRTSSTGPATSITFSALPPSPVSSSRPSSLNPARSGSLSGPHSSTVGSGNSLVLQAPQHTSHHPRNNPRPSSPPLDNASMLTLASSAFASPGARTVWNGGAGGDSTSHLGGGDSVSHFPGDDALLAEDRDASVRALRPRSSRRGSWDSEASGWSARVSGVGSGGFGMRERSVRTAPSYRTGGLTVDDHDENGSMEDGDGDGDGDASYSRVEGEEDQEMGMGLADGDDVEGMDKLEDGEKDDMRSPSATPEFSNENDEVQSSDDYEDVATPGMPTRPLEDVPDTPNAPDETPKTEKNVTLEPADHEEVHV